MIFNYIITCIIDFLLDPLKPHFYSISTGLRGSIPHADISMMPIYGINPLKIFFSGTSRPILTKLDKKHWRLKLIVFS